jgi:chemotaxis protein MotB
MAANVAPIIIIKRKKKGHAAHHGGAWKVAYADFVTAMMAFFLLLWLLNSTTQEQRSGISEYFNAASVSRNTSGAGKILGGATITLDGPSKGKGAPIGLPIPTPEKDTAKTDAESEDKVNAGAKDERSKDPDNAGKNKELPTDNMSEAQMKEVMRKREDKMFEKAEKALKRAVETTPGLRRLSENLVVERTAEGLRIQIIDQDKTSMFASGSSVPYQHARQLIEVIAQVIAKMPNKVSLSGHTDGTPYARGASYTNWELSTDRAHAARRLLIRYGLKSKRLRRVVLPRRHGTLDQVRPHFTPQPATIDYAVASRRHTAQGWHIPPSTTDQIPVTRPRAGAANPRACARNPESDASATRRLG